MNNKIIKQIGKLVNRNRHLVNKPELEALKDKIRKGEKPRLTSRRSR